MKKLFKKFETVAMAAAFAEEGEFKTAQELMKEEGRVLLAINEGKVDEKTIRYAVSTCKRIGAGLDILYISSKRIIEPAMEHQLALLDAERVPFKMIRREGYIKQEIIDYTNSNKEILFAITDSSDHSNIEYKSKRNRLSDTWQNLKCPLVVVTDSM